MYLRAARSQNRAWAALAVDGGTAETELHTSRRIRVVFDGLAQGLA